MLENSLKKLSIKELETIIAAAVSDAVGENLDARIESVTFKDTALSNGSFSVHLFRPLFGNKDD
jgi:hypothetical protein